LIQNIIVTNIQRERERDAQHTGGESEPLGGVQGTPFGFGRPQVFDVPVQKFKRQLLYWRDVNISSTNSHFTKAPIYLSTHTYTQKKNIHISVRYLIRTRGGGVLEFAIGSAAGRGRGTVALLGGLYDAVTAET
jgi:hypothetical protein